MKVMGTTNIPSVQIPQTTPPSPWYTTVSGTPAPEPAATNEYKNDEKVEVSYTDPQAQFIEEMREKLGMLNDEELRATEE